MPVQMNMWRIDDGRPRQLVSKPLGAEVTLEETLEQDPSILGMRLLIIGRQVPTAYGKFIDLLAIDADGNLHVLELKRDRTPRDVVAQLLDYGSWVTTLSREEVLELASTYLAVPFEEAFADTFGIPTPDELNSDVNMIVVASDLDNSSERIVSYLSTFNVPINAVLFTFLEDDGRSYLARSWFVDPQEVASSAGTSSKRAAWNGQDWYVAFGDEALRVWEDARRFGFVSAGGDPWYSRTLCALPVGARVNVHIPKKGYVGIGTVIGPAARFHDTTVFFDGAWQQLDQLPVTGVYRHTAEEDRNADNDEYVVPVEWIETRPESEAFWQKGMFANQNSACKLRQDFTLTALAREFRLDDSA